MKKLKILNLYACLGGNRYKWSDVSDVDVTAVEIDPELATLYQERFPLDNVVVGDAHEFLRKNYMDFDFIWSSPPCPTHSRARHCRKNRSDFEAVYPSMILYEEILFLKSYFKGLFCVENVVPFYEPLIKGQKRGRHIYWCNFNIPMNLGQRECDAMAGKGEMKKWCDFHDYDFYKYNGDQRRDKVARNLVDYIVGKNILSAALGDNYSSVLGSEIQMF